MSENDQENPDFGHNGHNSEERRVSMHCTPLKGWKMAGRLANWSFFGNFGQIMA
jgi:hypothetical protein